MGLRDEGLINAGAHERFFAGTFLGLVTAGSIVKTHGTPGFRLERAKAFPPAGADGQCNKCHVGRCNTGPRVQRGLLTWPQTLADV